MIILIAAIGKNNELGKNNTLVWHLPKDFKRFKAITTGHYIIMGRKTFESFPKPLPNRTHIIISRNKTYQPDGCIVVSSIEEALLKVPKQEATFIIGGGEIYKLSMPLADKLEITRVYESFDADTFFPEINLKNWRLILDEHHTKDETHNYDFSYQTYVRK